MPIAAPHSMQRVELSRSKTSGFRVMAGSERSQAAHMRLDPGESTGGEDNRHAGSDQWLYVVAGFGVARVEGCEVLLEPGTLLLIEAGEAHEIRNLENEPLETWNVYAPPAYSDSDADRG